MHNFKSMNIGNSPNGKRLGRGKKNRVSNNENRYPKFLLHMPITTKHEHPNLTHRAHDNPKNRLGTRNVI